MFKSKKFSALSIFSLFIFILFIGINSVFAETTKTETLDLTNQETVDKLSDEGWSWDSENQKLILKNIDIETTELSPCIKLPAGDVTIEFEGNNTLKAEKGTVLLNDRNTNLTLQSSKNGVLNLEITQPQTNTNDTHGLANIGATILHPYNLNIKSGTINSIGGFFVDGVVTISGGSVNIDTENMTYGSDNNEVKGIYALRQVNITGGNVNIKSTTSAINVTGIAGATDYPDGVVISGGNVTLSTQSDSLPAIYTGNYQRKNIIIDGGKITLKGGYGAYTANGVIKVNRLDSLNKDNVKGEVFKVSSRYDTNEIIYADADYSKVDEAIKKAKSLNKSNYKNFDLVEKAIAAVIRGKNVLEQNEVDKMALAINKAIDELILNKKVQNVVNPNTSDININLLLILFTLSGLGIVYTVKREY